MSVRSIGSARGCACVLRLACRRSEADRAAASRLRMCCANSPDISPSKCNKARRMASSWAACDLIWERSPRHARDGGAEFTDPACLDVTLVGGVLDAAPSFFIAQRVAVVAVKRGAAAAASHRAAIDLRSPVPLRLVASLEQGSDAGGELQAASRTGRMYRRCGGCTASY
jgi:hypothetical protein